MPNETLPAERVHESVSTDGLRLGGALWVIAGVICAGLLIFVFVGEPTVLLVVVMVILLLVVLGLIELIGRPPATPEVAGHAQGT